VTSRRFIAAIFGPTIVVSALATACLAGDGPGYLPDETPKTPPDLGLDDGGFVKSDADPGDPFGIDGLSPSHGPFKGGTRAFIRGRGFSSKLRVFFGPNEATGDILASDPTRVAIDTPAGNPGFVDVRIRDEATSKERVLENGFYYDAFYAVPSTGATTGGTRIALTGSGTQWSAGTKVTIGGAPCDSVVVQSPTKIECVTPASTPGVKDITVITPDLASQQARDGFTYSDSTDGYRGGISGSAFSGRMKVLVFNSWFGTAIPGAEVIVGTNLKDGVRKQTGVNGVVEVADLPTGTPPTVTISAKCHQPYTFVDVPVDTVTVYLDPVLDLSCVELDPTTPGGGGGGGRFGGIVEGQLIFPGAGEFERVGWTTVPSPTRPTERRAAYAFSAASSPNGTFQLPPASEAVTPDSPGSSGFDYSVVVYPGNVTVYVVAGLEDRSFTPARFVPYSMGVVRGVSVPPQAAVQGVDVKMDILFDHQVTLAPTPPTPGVRGPDRLSSDIALTLGSVGYAILPAANRTVPLPFSGEIDFVGMPSLDKGIAGEQYVIGSVAATSADLARPASVVSRIRTTNANTPVVIGGFLGVPVPVQPSAGSWVADDTAQALPVKFDGASGSVDLTVVRVNSGAGLVAWTIVAPGAKKDFTVPDISKLPQIIEDGDLVWTHGLVRGGISTSFSVARIDDFKYETLRLGQLSPTAWSAYAIDSINGAY
jgi:hypothetical protein